MKIVDLLYCFSKHIPLSSILPLLFLACFAGWQCQPLQYRYVKEEDVERRPAPAVEAPPHDFIRMAARTSCADPAHYVPDTNRMEFFPIRFLRVNFHFLNTRDRLYNYDGEAAEAFVQSLLSSANRDLEVNYKMWLPPGNDTPVLPVGFRYALSPRPGVPEDKGIYFHYDDELCFYIHKGAHRNLMDRRVIQQYGVQLDTVLNVFIMPHHPDSLDSPTYSPGHVGVALGNAVKIAGAYEQNSPGWALRGVLNHEAGHIFGLAHTWAFNDGCDDTPRHPGNCWNRTAHPPCDRETSNNVMDYNAMQHAWTPCQIGKVHAAIARLNGPARRLIEPRWCEYHPGMNIHIRDHVTWSGMKDLGGDLVIEDGGVLTVQCRVSLPAGARLRVMPGATLILDNAQLHNACGERWEGIEIASKGGRRGRVVFIGAPSIEDALHDIGL
jgi:hypothetical protein